MARDWQQTKMKQYVMPHAVYYQSLWAVRDLERMEERLEQLKGYAGHACSSSILCEGKMEQGNISRPTEDQAVEISVLEMRIRGIREALDIVPKIYVPYIMSNIVLRNSGADFPIIEWRMWKQRFLYEVAKNLDIM